MIIGQGGEVGILQHGSPERSDCADRSIVCGCCDIVRWPRSQEIGGNANSCPAQSVGIASRSVIWHSVEGDSICCVIIGVFAGNDCEEARSAHAIPCHRAHSVLRAADRDDAESTGETNRRLDCAEVVALSWADLFKVHLSACEPYKNDSAYD